jgi:ABC-type multidrug transport system permease subunit
VLLAVGLLRALQTQTGEHLHGNWSWVPYVVVLVVCAAVIGLLATRMGKRKGSTR